MESQRSVLGEPAQQRPAVWNEMPQRFLSSCANGSSFAKEMIGANIPIHSPFRNASLSENSASAGTLPGLGGG